MCATINILQNLPRGALIRAVLLLSSEEYKAYESQLHPEKVPAL